MSTNPLARPVTAPSEMSVILEDLQRENITLALPPFFFAGLALMLSHNPSGEHLEALWPGLAIFVLPLLVLAVRTRSYRAASWLLVLGCLASLELAVRWAHVDAALNLLALPAGLAALFVSLPGGVLAAIGTTALLAFAPPGWLPADGTLRLMLAVSAWSTVGLVWLTLRPLVTTTEWSWSSYEQSRRLLERARGYQVQLKQTVQDLADANLQLTRLNLLAQRLRSEAEEARRAKEQFVANVSHELRTPLNMVIGFGEMIMAAPKAYGRVPQALLADLAVIVRNSQHLAALIDDVLDLSQIEAGQMALTREQASLREIVEAAIIAVRPLFDSKHLYLETDLTGDDTLYCDRTRLREVVLNLLSNAGRFTEQGGVRLRAWREKDELVVSVADTGPGIAPEDEGRLFQPFQQLDGSIRRRYGGTGLGLAISRSIVELHGGSISLQTELGKGATFVFRLPVGPPPPADGGMARWFSPHWTYEERGRRSLAPAPVVRPRFVVLEAGNALAHLLSRYMDNVEIVSAPDLDAAVRELSRSPAQAVLANGAQAEEALAHLKRSPDLPYGTPLVACAVPELSDAAGTLGATDYLVKPVTRDQLLGTLARLLPRGGTVLIVDDEPEAQQLFWRVLSSAGAHYEVLTASDGGEALHLIRRERPDMVLLDLVMPEMDGFRLLEARRQDPALRTVPFVIISARDPAGEPIVSEALTVTRGGGLTVPQLLACIEAMSSILGTAGQYSPPAPRAAPAG